MTDAKDKAQVKRYDLVTDREGNVSLEEIASGSYVDFDAIAHLLQAQPTEAVELSDDDRERVEEIRGSDMYNGTLCRRRDDLIAIIDKLTQKRSGV